MSCTGRSGWSDSRSAVTNQACICRHPASKPEHRTTPGMPDNSFGRPSHLAMHRLLLE
jgi:hypothetical protein